MRALIAMTLQLALLSGCATFNHPGESVSAVVARPITLDWGIKMHNPGRMQYQYQGIPGNLATIPNTLTPQLGELSAIVLGQPLPVGDSVTIRILGVHEQVNRQGLISTIIATTDQGLDFESLEAEHTGALGVIEAGLLQLTGNQSRSLGFRSEASALATIRRYQESFRSDG